MLVAVTANITLADGSYDRRARNLNFEKICQQSALRKKQTIDLVNIRDEEEQGSAIITRMQRMTCMTLIRA